MSEKNKEVFEQLERINRLVSLLEKTFTPSAPVESKTIFSGRSSQLLDCVSIFQQPGTHAILYGERGVGKTSIANVVRLFITGEDRTVIKRVCHSSDTFETLMMSVLSEISVEVDKTDSSYSSGGGIGYTADIQPRKVSISLSEIIRNVKVTPRNIAKLLEKAGNVFIILDEFDRIPREFNLAHFTDLLKSLSDSACPVKFLIVGVADDVNGLLGAHESITRNLKQIHLEVMAPEELAEIIKKGLAALEMEMPDDIQKEITEFSCGYPHYTHLLAYHCCKNAIHQLRDNVESADLAYAIDKAVSNSNEGLKKSYQLATAANRQNIYKEVLLACGSAKVDEYGTFQPKDVEKPLSDILRKPIKANQFGAHLIKLCEDTRGRILVSTGERGRARYKFRDPLMRAFVKLNARRLSRSS